MRIGSLFSGIGGLELGLEWSGLGDVVWQVEIDPFCRSVLEKHWPNVTRREDVKECNRHNLPPVDVLCGGFPCQDVSSAGKGAGLSGERSGLWYEYLRIVGELRPRIVIVENVASGAKRWLCPVRGGLRTLGYRTRAIRVSAQDVGAPHLRKRIFVVAYAERVQLRDEQGRIGGPGRQGAPEPRDTGSPWETRPAIRRVDNGVSRRMDRARLKALGNAVVPQCAEVVGKIILRDILP
jgi:DNA (cytosine-5)-methyltransferase 1